MMATLFTCSALARYCAPSLPIGFLSRSNPVSVYNIDDDICEMDEDGMMITLLSRNASAR